MLSFEKCKQILNNSENKYSDEKIKEFIERFYLLAEIEINIKHKDNDEECSDLLSSINKRTS